MSATPAAVPPIAARVVRPLPFDPTVEASLASPARPTRSSPRPDGRENSRPDAVSPPATALRSRAEAELLYLSHIQLINKLAREVAWRRGIRFHDAADFASDVHLRLIEREYAVLRRFRGASSACAQFLRTVIDRLALDWHVRQRGKYRPTAEMVRLGPGAVTVERLMRRQGFTAEEAWEEVRTTSGWTDRAEFERILGRMRHTSRGKHVPLRDVDESAFASPAACPDSRLEGAAVWERFRRALAHALRALDDADRVLLRLRHGQALRVCEIARMTNVPAKLLHSRLERIHRRLRKVLESAGWAWLDVCRALPQSA
ncbi:MAG: sigma-70 family RNA polymerase sigma factor [Vicinamibacterales bacterium]